ncbi:MAG: response regulator [Candidatus Aminicenantales bacterium]
MKKLLILEDDKLIRWSLKQIYSQEGHSVDEAESIEEALKAVEKMGYDLVFSDLEINKESSIDLLEKIEKLHPETKIIILSALPRVEAELLLKKLRVFAIVEKPFRAEEVKAIAKEALQNPDCRKEVRIERDNNHEGKGV